MKTLQLSEEQMIRLIEMSSAFFTFESDMQFGVKETHNWSRSFLVAQQDVLNNDWFICHWFEFTVTHLANAVFKALSENDYHREVFAKELGKGLQELITDSENAIHPIDWLYDGYQSLPLTNMIKILDKDE